MDTSEIYIKMCEKAVEIQKLWKPTDGDFCWHDNEGEECWGSWEYPAQTSVVTVSQKTPIDWWYSWLWLPRQDQLQEMLDWSCWQLTARFAEFAHIEAGQIPSRFTSMEQLWLAFVMKEKFNKIWDGEKWKHSN